jgi:hypothetical protein
MSETRHYPVADLLGMAPERINRASTAYVNGELVLTVNIS